MSKKRYEWIFENGENEIIDNLAGRYVTISSPELLNEKDEKISDLEAKLAEYKQHTKIALEDFNEIQNENDKLAHQLAEKDKAIENWQTMYQSVVQTCHNDAKEIKKLKKQNDDYADSLTKVLNENADLVFKLADKDKEITQRLVIQEKDYNQDKISFAVEQLELLKNCKIVVPNMLNIKDTNFYITLKSIDNLINELKEME